MRRELLGSDHQDVLKSSFELAQIQVEQGHSEEALKMLRDVASRQDKLLGCHPYTVQTYNALGSLLEKFGNNCEAKSVRSKAEEYSCEINKRQIEYRRLSSDEN